MIPSREEMGYILMIWGFGLMFMGCCMIAGGALGALAGF